MEKVFLGRKSVICINLMGEMLKKAAFFYVFLAVLCGFITTAKASTSSIMVNADDGKVMYEQNADELRYPASLTKLMTLYITFNALENGHLKLTDKLKVSRVAASRSPSKLGVKAGTTITVKDAIMAVIVKSANDCATVLAEHFAKSEADFAVLMTKTAHKLGMNNTTFKNASGLPNSKQKSTARDMSKLAMAVYHHFPQYYKWFSVQSFRYKGQTITGHNHLLKSFAGADGMKTGYTAASGYNIVTSAHRNNKRVIAVTMGHRYLNERDKKAALMMEKGLKHLKENSTVQVAALSKEINGGTPAATTKPASTGTVKLAQAPQAKPTIAQVPTVHNGKYAVQIGSFSDYRRAKNYAVTVKNNLAKKFAVYDVKVEKIQAKNATLYRSKVIGLARQDAQRICQNMKQQKKSCLVVADNNTMKLAQK